MQRSTVHTLSTLVMLAGFSACTSDRAASPTENKPTPQQPTAPTTPATPPTQPFPTPSPGWTAYDRVVSSPEPVKTRLVFSLSGWFVLRSSGPGINKVSAGDYARVSSAIQFTFPYQPSEARWAAKGIVRNDSLFVEYNDVMHAAGFVDGAYTLVVDAETIFVSSATSSADALRLTYGGWPTWSPDSRKIAFHRAGRICVIEVVEANEACVADGGFPTWSPDGKRIAFVNDQGIAVMDADGSRVTTLLRHKFLTDTWAPWDIGVAKPAWSPDGRLIAFEHLGDGDLQPSRVFVIGLDGSEPRQLVSNDGTSEPAWLSNGESVLLWSFQRGVATVPATGGAPTTIYYDPPAVSYGSRPTQSPDGRTAFSSRTTAARKILIAVPRSPTATLFAEGYDAAWSPNGQRIAFVRASK